LFLHLSNKDCFIPSQALGRPDSDVVYGWRLLFAVPLLFSLVQLALLPWSPRSPGFLLIKRKNEAAAKRALKRLRGASANTDEEIQEMQAELDNQQQRIKFGELLTINYMRRALFVSIGLHLAQQLSGISGIFYYSTSVFKLAGVNDADIATVAVGLVLVIVTFITVFIIELAGRRTLMLYGLGGMAVSFLLLTSMFCLQDGFYHNSSSHYVTAPGVLLVIFSLTTVALFAMGPGSIPWLMVSELFLQEARPIAVGIATSVNWFANFTVGLTFPYILKYLYPYGTSVFAVTCGALWVYLYRYLPETKGLSVEQVTAGLRRSVGT
jgi:sugar porter (SP) family MFS transporter